MGARPLDARSLGARLAFLADRTLVLFMGVGVGAAIALAFVGGGRVVLSVPVASPAVPIAHAALSPAARPRVPERPPPVLDCAAPFPPRLAARIAAGRPVTVGVFGDSFAEGLWAVLFQRLAGDNIKVLRLSQVGSGFTRYQTVNLERRAAEQLNAEPVDVAVISIGANDTQGVFDEAHEHAYPFMTPGWQAVYGARLDRFVTLIRAQGGMVYWVGLPRMRQPAFDQDIMALNDFDAARMAALNVPFLSTQGLSVDSQGRYNAYLAGADGKGAKLVRANDGVHMTFAGYDRLAGPLVDRIHLYLAAAARQAKRDTGPSAPASGRS